MDSPAPQTIPEMLEALGAPRNYAEQGLMRDMRKLERRQAKAESEAGAAGAMTDIRREYCRERANAAWSEALAYKYAIEQFRLWGARPIIEEYDAIADRLDAGAAAHRERTTDN